MLAVVVVVVVHMQSEAARRNSGNGAVFLAWAPHSERAKGISERMGADLFLMSYKFRNKAYAPAKYPALFVKSFLLLKRKKPDMVLCQAPPIFCPLAAIAYRLLANRRARIIVDMHSGALERPWTWLKPLNSAVLRRANAVLVSNAGARERVAKQNGVRPFVLEDRVPDFGPVASDGGGVGVGGGGGARYRGNRNLKIVVPSSFAYDEPVKEILAAAAELDSDVTFYLTGDSSPVDDRLKEKARNVVFTGFLGRDEYVRLLQGSDAVMVLTTRDRTLLAGGYEALALQKPLITSNWEPLKRYFDKGAIHVDNSAPEIVAAVRALREKKVQLQQEMRQLREEKSRRWEESFARLWDSIA
ncbi:glycosyltransferase [Nitrososphaera sp.]|uniref:glycosyltransferase n=1 Tax=Nitrososphaera sp. TaxID=1971748 RepID=UPI00307F3B08